MKILLKCCNCTCLVVSCLQRVICDYIQLRFSALDKLLDQLGIYATWLSSIGYLQKQLRIFYFFYATFFSVITHLFILNETIGNVPAYLLTPIVCLSRVSNYRILLYLKQISPPRHLSLAYTLQSYTFILFSANTWLGTSILFIKLELYLHTLVKKKARSADNRLSPDFLVCWQPVVTSKKSADNQLYIFQYQCVCVSVQSRIAAKGADRAHPT